MTRFLLFQLYAPLASWGTVAVGEERPTSPTPGKGAIAGLLGAALGIRRHEHDRLAPLWSDYHFALRVDAAGQMLVDYHTVQSASLGKRDRIPATRRQELAHPKIGTVITLREYLTGGAWVVCWWPCVAEPAHGLQDLAAALERPALTLYLGRKSCPPALPLAPRIEEGADWYTVLRRAQRAGAPGWGRAVEDAPHFLPLEQGRRDFTWLTPPRYRWDEAAGKPSELEQHIVESRMDVPVHRGRWQFTQRAECVAQPPTEEARHE